MKFLIDNWLFVNVPVCHLFKSAGSSNLHYIYLYITFTTEIVKFHNVEKFVTCDLFSLLTVKIMQILIHPMILDLLCYVTLPEKLAITASGRPCCSQIFASSTGSHLHASITALRLCFISSSSLVAWLESQVSTCVLNVFHESLTNKTSAKICHSFFSGFNDKEPNYTSLWKIQF